MHFHASLHHDPHAYPPRILHHDPVHPPMPYPMHSSQLVTRYPGPAMAVPLPQWQEHDNYEIIEILELRVNPVPHQTFLQYRARWAAPYDTPQWTSQWYEASGLDKCPDVINEFAATDTNKAFWQNPATVIWLLTHPTGVAAPLWPLVPMVVRQALPTTHPLHH